MLKIKKAKSDRIHSIYKDMCEQFPLNELKELEELECLVQQYDNVYNFYEVYENNESIGYFSLFNPQNNFLWLDYFAVYRKNHSQGYGSKILDTIKSEFKKEYKGLFLEVELPDKNKPNTIRRVAFYERKDAVKIDCKYFFPSKKNLIELSLYYIPFTPKEPDKHEVKNTVQKALGYIHSGNNLSINAMEKFKI